MIDEIPTITEGNFNDVTALGEKQWWFYVENDRSIEVTHESHGLPEEDWYYSVRLHCNEEEYDSGSFDACEGVIEQINVGHIGEVNEAINELVKINAEV